MTTTTQNPYASFLGTRDAKTVIAETPAKLKSLSSQISNLDRPPAPAMEPQGNPLPPCRLRASLRRPPPPHHDRAPSRHPTFDQDHWARPYPSFTADQALAVFTASGNGTSP